MITSIRINCVGMSAIGSLLSGGVSAFPRNAVGFMHLLERKLNHQNLSIGSNRKVAVGVENYFIHQGEKNCSTPKMSLSKPWIGHNQQEISVLDYEWKCNATITLLIKSSGTFETDAVRTALISIIPSLRFANGSIFVKNNFLQIIDGNDDESLLSSIKSIKALRASFITCRSDLIVENEEINSLIDALSLFKVSDNNNQSSENSSEASIESSKNANDSTSSLVESQNRSNKQQWEKKEDFGGWIIPIERGYYAVSKPIINPLGVRNPTVPAIIATPTISLGQFVSYKNMINDQLKAFWYSSSNRESGYYLFNANPF